MKKWLVVFMGVMVLGGCASDNAVDRKVLGKGVNVEQLAELEGYEEYEVLSEKIDLVTYEVVIETDNPGNRVLLFAEANGEKVYKSIFIKNNNHLKIINLHDEGLIYNDNLK